MSLTLLFSLGACNNSQTDSTTESTSPQETAETEEENVSEEPTTEPKEEVKSEEIPPQEFIENTDLKVIIAYSYDTYNHIVVENVSDNPILDYHVAYIELITTVFL